MNLWRRTGFLIGKGQRSVIICVIEISIYGIWLYINIMALSEQETTFLSTLASTRKNIFTFEDARMFWGESARTANALSRLAHKGWIKRLDRGTYLIVPLEAGPEQTWSESGLVIAPYLIKPAAVAYWSALHYWNMTEQILLTLFGQEFRFITVRPERFFGIYERTADDRRIVVTDREKTLLDAAARPDLSGGIAQLSQAMKAANANLDWEKLDAYLETWGGGTVVKRLGYLLEILALNVVGNEQRLVRWRNMLSEGISLLEPGSQARGPVVTRWRLMVNITL
jgi:predicted transcriptional regulator of viral defense system